MKSLWLQVADILTDLLEVCTRQSLCHFIERKYCLLELLLQNGGKFHFFIVLVAEWSIARTNGAEKKSVEYFTNAIDKVKAHL